MPKKPNEREKSSEIESDDDDAPDPNMSGERKELLAQIAAHVAASVMLAPSKKITTPASIAVVSVDIAEAILQRVGL